VDVFERLMTMLRGTAKAAREKADEQGMAPPGTSREGESPAGAAGSAPPGEPAPEERREPDRP